MRRTLLLSVLAGAVVGFLSSGALRSTEAHGAEVAPPREMNQQWNFRGGVVIGGNQGGTKISATTKGTLDYDFPSLSSSSAALQTVCATSGNVTVRGARFGDVCTVGVDQALTNYFGTLLTYVSAADTAVIQACAVGVTDGGTFNMPDAGYTVRCFSP